MFSMRGARLSEVINRHQCMFYQIVVIESYNIDGFYTALGQNALKSWLMNSYLYRSETLV